MNLKEKYKCRQFSLVLQGHRRRIYLEDKAKKVIASDWGTELNRLFQKDRGKPASVARGTVELNRLFQKDQGKTASAARILSPNPMQQLLPCLLIQSFFYVQGEGGLATLFKHCLMLILWSCRGASICGQIQEPCTKFSYWAQQFFTSPQLY